MYHFECDYTEGAHPSIIERLVATNFEQTCGYGCDEYCTSAKEKIKLACDSKDADVHFLVGGTQANTIIIKSTLRPYQGVISADTGHINVHETGAIEAIGHKVLSVNNNDGKINAQQVDETMKTHLNDSSFEHTVQPGMVYISFPTETGTLYSKQELIDLYEVCQKYQLPLFIDGARMGYGLCAETNDCSLADIYKYSDVFYIGGTKVGALFGEAVVIKNKNISKDFRYMIKQHGGMLAKGRLLGIQFDTLFTNNLYFDISIHAIKMAMKIKKGILDAELSLFANSYTNQQFLLLNESQFKKLSSKYCVTLWEKNDDKYAIRICTSWATNEDQVNQLIEDLKNL